MLEHDCQDCIHLIDCPHVGKTDCKRFEHWLLALYTDYLVRGLTENHLTGTNEHPSFSCSVCGRYKKCREEKNTR